MANHFYHDTDYSEANWRNDDAAQESAASARDARDLQDWQETDLADDGDTRPLRCDGDGILQEYYTDVDQTQVIPCPGCPACDPVSTPVPETVAAQPQQPLWEGMAVQDIPSKPMSPAPSSIPWTRPSVASSSSGPGYARIGNGLYARTGGHGRRRA
jgi:hypothetical protein